MNLDVLIPSLLLPAPTQTLFSPPLVPALEKLLSRADRQADAALAWSSWLFKRWGVGTGAPLAAVLAEYDGLDSANDGWMFAEPIHLVADRDRLTMFSSHFLELNSVETAAFISALNVHFADRKLQFYAPTIERWYVRCRSAEIPETTPPDFARTGSLIDFQPKSHGAINWRAVQNEAQMLFFSHAINDDRQMDGKVVASGVWFWGGGVSPTLKKPAYDHVIASSPLVTQLAKKTGIDVQPLSWGSMRLARGNVLLVLDSCAELANRGEFSLLGKEFERLDREWFLPMSQALGKGGIEHLTLLVPDAESIQSFQITRRNQLLRFWRTARPLATYA